MRAGPGPHAWPSGALRARRRCAAVEAHQLFVQPLDFAAEPFVGGDEFLRVGALQVEVGIVHLLAERGALGFLAPDIALERLAPAGAPFALAALLYFVVVRGGAVRPGFAGSGRRRRGLGAYGASADSSGRAVGGASTVVGSASAVAGAF